MAKVTKTILYVKKSTSGEFVGKVYEVDINSRVVVRDGDASFSPSAFEIDGSTLIASDPSFVVVCDIVGTREVDEDE